MDEDAFYVRVGEIYNDLLLTNAQANATDFPTQNFELDNFADASYLNNRGPDAVHG